VFLQYFDTVGWVLWPVKNRRPYNLYCVGGDVKPCSINQSIKSSVLRPRQHSIGLYGPDYGFYRSKDPTNSIKVLKEQIVNASSFKLYYEVIASSSRGPFFCYDAIR